MKRNGLWWSVAVWLAGAVIAGAGPLADLEGRLAALPGSFNLDSRIRYEVFDQGGGPDVDGASHRIRYGYTTGELGGLRAMVEGETVYAWGHGRDLHPADNAGDGTDLNQLWLAYRDADLGNIKLGRQIYTLDDHRFIGHVGWRQNIQTFDAVTAEAALIENLSVKAFYIDAVNTVTAAHNNIEASGLNAAWALPGSQLLTFFYYSIDGRPDSAAASGDTAGLRLTGSLTNGDLKAGYAVSYARQWENSGFPGADFGHDYFSVDGSLELGGLTLGGGIEILDGDGIHGFSTPLATLHAFNGFADVFLAASGSGGLVNGLEDYHIHAGYRFDIGNGLKARLIQHWFKPSSGSGDYGSEIDLVASYPFSKRLSILAKYGDYTSDGGSGGVGTRDKTMVSVELNFVY